MHTYQIRVSDEIITKFLWLLEYFKKDIEIIKISTDNDFISTMNESKKDIEKGNVSPFNFDDFERKIG
ncbi:MAG: Unknown protein [uncultured Sulfurovum sp.]|uniref:Uncharacterized protein n=1 Tax=uncultured Sulfurovum sp. TaxID=269237 RepID=A0A6S6U3K7_9BACT|nr:MAG: Unknown protein [uncultured Sulfurovum sp.]